MSRGSAQSTGSRVVEISFVRVVAPDRRLGMQPRVDLQDELLRGEPLRTFRGDFPIGSSTRRHKFCRIKFAKWDHEVSTRAADATRLFGRRSA